MEFSEKELVLIASAKKKSSDATTMRVFVVAAMVVGIGLMFAGVVGTKRLAYVLVAAVFVSIAHPQFGDGPKYEDLVKPLESKARSERLTT